MKITRILFIIPLILLMFLLSGCIQIDIDTGIYTNFTAYLSYTITLDVSEDDLLDQSMFLIALNRIGLHYQDNLGFTVGLNTEEPPYTMTMTRRVENENLEQAFDSLRDMLTDEDMTLFMQVEIAAQSFERQDRFMFFAMADIPQIMRLSNAEELPLEVLQELEEAIETGSGTITLSLPARELISHSHQARIESNRAVMEVPIDFSGQTAFELSAKRSFQGDGTPRGSFEEIIQELAQLRYIALIACCVAVLILLIALLVIIGSVRRKRDYKALISYP